MNNTKYSVNVLEDVKGDVSRVKSSNDELIDRTYDISGTAKNMYESLCYRNY